MSPIASRPCILAAISVAVVLAQAAAAGAASVTASSCVRVQRGANSAKVAIGGDGFTPGALVTVRGASLPGQAPEFLTQTTADPAGRFATTVSSPGFAATATQQEVVRLIADETIDPARSATTTFKQVRVGYTTSPATKDPQRVVTHTVRGLTPGKNTYIHFRLAGRTKRTVKLGRATGACGIVTRRLALLPVTPIRAGIWNIYVDQAKTFKLGASGQLRYSLPVT
jgi:hypothetical protein